MIYNGSEKVKPREVQGLPEGAACLTPPACTVRGNWTNLGRSPNCRAFPGRGFAPARFSGKEIGTPEMVVFTHPGRMCRQQAKAHFSEKGVAFPERNVAQKACD